MSKSEQLAKKWFTAFNNNRMLIAFISMFTLTACSIYFNFRLGTLNANPGDKTSIVMPLSYSFLDVAALVLAMVLFAGLIKGATLKLVSWTWFGYLVTLSLFACLSCIIALDAQNSSSGDEFKRQQLEQALNTANSNVNTWTNNVALTVKHKSRFQDRLDHAIDSRNQLIDDISKLDSSTPPAQIIFEKVAPFLPIWMDSEQFRLLARLAFGLAMIITPLLLTGVMAHVMGDEPKPKGATRLGKPQASTQGRPEQNSTKKSTETEKVPEKKSRLGQNSTKSDPIKLKVVKNSPPKKAKGAGGKTKSAIKSAVLNGEWTNYDDFVKRFAIGRGTISAALKELKADGLIERNGHSVIVKHKAKEA
jgi:hypothetical protein